ncbi:hypothetical protein B0H11DRAFT_1938027 [Mycena galericulata]|nr:hypothetical protein B0H11DRAFT_1938027 [Mycena galericulata]
MYHSERLEVHTKIMDSLPVTVDPKQLSTDKLVALLGVYSIQIAWHPYQVVGDLMEILKPKPIPLSTPVGSQQWDTPGNEEQEDPSDFGSALHDLFATAAAALPDDLCMKIAHLTSRASCSDVENILASTICPYSLLWGPSGTELSDSQSEIGSHHCRTLQSPHQGGSKRACTEMPLPPSSAHHHPGSSMGQILTECHVQWWRSSTHSSASTKNSDNGGKKEPTPPPSSASRKVEKHCLELQ